MNRNRDDFPTLAECCQQAARQVVAVARGCVADRGRFNLVLSGGSTPAPLYQLLARPPLVEEMPWSRTHLFWGDERCVPPDHPDSNYHLARENLIRHLDIPTGNVHRMAGDLDPATGALAYQGMLRDFFRQGSGPANSPPSFDLVLLGMGVDGHTASLFPTTAVLNEREKWVAAVPPPSLPPHVARLTLTLPLLNQARTVFFLVAGPEKRPMVDAILAAAPEDMAVRYPAALVSPRDEIHWYVAEG